MSTYSHAASVKIFIWSTQTVKKRGYFYTEIFVSKHLYECSNRVFYVMAIYQKDDYTLLQIKEKENFTDVSNINQNRKVSTQTHLQNHS